MIQNTFYILKRLFILGGVLFALVFLYELNYYPKTLKKEGWLKLKGDSIYSLKSDIIYFSASPNKSYALTEKNRLSIHTFAQQELKDYSIRSLDTGAIHAGIFLHALHHLPQKNKPKMIVVDLNLRSFGSNWIESDLENNLQLNLNYWNQNYGLVNRMNAALKNYAFISNEERNKRIVYQHDFVKLPFHGSQSTVRKWNDSLQKSTQTYKEIACAFVRSFGFEVKSNNPMLHSYKSIQKYCEENGIKLIFLFLPENLDMMEKLAGKELKLLCLQNRSRIKRELGEKAVILDLMDHFDASFFFESFPTEHYYAPGREYIGKKMAASILENIKQCK
jgi:hypothetical protein